MGTTYELTGNLRDVIPGGVSSVHAAYIETNVPDGQALVDTTSDGGIAPSNVGRIAMAGDTFTLELLGTNNTGLNVAPGALRYRVHVEHGKPGLKGLFHWYSAWFELTEDANLKTVVGELELVAPSTVADLLQAQISGYEEHGNVSGAVTFYGPTASHRFDATGPTAITLADYAEGQVATLICFSGADDVTVNDAGDVALADGTAWTAELARDVWVSGGGGGTPAAPDTTPPSALLGLTAVPGDDGDSVALTWTDATDAETSVKYRFRIYPTGDVVPAWPTSGPLYNLTGTSLTVTGLDGGTAYTVEGHAYSTGGSGLSDSDTFTTPAPLTTVLTDTFTQADGSIGARVANSGQTWTGATSGSQILANRVKPNTTGVWINHAATVAREVTFTAYFADAATYLRVLAWSDSSGSGGCGVTIKQNGQVELSGIADPATYNVQGTGYYFTSVGYLTLATATPHSIKVTYDGTSVALYVNGTRIIEGTPTVDMTGTYLATSGDGGALDDLSVKAIA